PEVLATPAIIPTDHRLPALRRSASQAGRRRFEPSRPWAGGRRAGPPAHDESWWAGLRGGDVHPRAARCGGRGSGVPVLALRIVPVRDNDQLVCDVVAVLLRPEGAPLAVVLEQLRCRRAEQPLRARVAVGDVDTGDLVVPVVLEAG